MGFETSLQFQPVISTTQTVSRHVQPPPSKTFTTKEERAYEKLDLNNDSWISRLATAIRDFVVSLFSALGALFQKSDTTDTKKTGEMKVEKQQGELSPTSNKTSHRGASRIGSANNRSQGSADRSISTTSTSSW